MNTSEYPPDGVYFRTGPDWATADRTAGFGVFAGDRVRLKCHASGTNVPRRDGGTNTIWYAADNTTRPTVAGRANSGWINAHFVNDGTGPNQVAPGVSPCGNGGVPIIVNPTPPGPTPEIAYGAPCAKTTFIVVPGSHETSEGSTPNAQVGLLQYVTGGYTGVPLSTLRIHYVGYPAELTARMSTYHESRAKGYQAAFSTIKGYADKCRRTGTKFVLLGYSQGAHVLGDLTATIGKESQPIAADQLLHTALLADPARDRNFQPLTGTSTKGGNGVMGSRSDFGAARSKVTEYCIAHDSICDIAGNPSKIRTLMDALRDGPHVQYQKNVVPGTKTTFTSKIASDLRRFF